MQRKYFGDWVKMVTKIHDVKTILAVISILVLVASIIGIITIDRQNYLWASNLSIAILVIIGLLYIWHFFFEIPAKVLEKNTNEITQDWQDKLNKQIEIYKRDTTKLSIINEQKKGLNRFIYSRFSHLYLRNNQQVDIEVEWFNGTLFELDFESVREGTVKINELQRKVESLDKRSCQHSSHCSYIITTSDKDIVDSIGDAITKNKPIKLLLIFTSDVIATYEYNPKYTQQWNVQCSINQWAIPEKV